MSNKDTINIISINSSIPDQIQPCFRNKDGTTMVSTNYDGHIFHEADERLIYTVNDHGHHGCNFFNNPDILAIGCSVTAGLGIPHDMTWPNLVARELGQTINVIGIPGAGVEQILHNALLHIKKFGKPKRIMFLIPDLFRAWIPVKSKYDKYYLQPLQWDYRIKEYSKLGKPILYKDWYSINRSIPAEVIINNSLIKMVDFKTLCELLDIELHYYSWDILYTNNFLEILKGLNNNSEEENYNNLNSINPDYTPDYGFDRYDNIICHHSDTQEHQPFWVRALDHPKTHPGMHAHIHYAEMFLQKKLSQQTINKSNNKLSNI